MTTLIVDDIAENLYLLVSLLKGDGHQAFSAANGAEALEILHSNPIDLIISDILMPKMDGFQLCKECKSDDNLKKIPFIFYTATYTDYSDEEFALKLGANRFIRKPIDPSEFLAIIRSVLQEVESGKVDTSRKTGIPEEKEILKLYSERLVKKLENKMLELEGEVKKRKKVEEELSKNEEKYRLLTENAAEAIIVVQDSYIKFMNKMAVQMVGYTMPELTSRSFIEFIYPEDRERVALNYSKLIKGEPIPKNYEFRIINKGGNILWIVVNASLFEWEGRPAALNMLTDITERKTTEEALIQSKAHLSNALKIARLGHWEYDVLRDEFTFTDEFYAIFRTTVEQMGGYVMSSARYAGLFVHPDDAYLVGEEVRKAIETKDPNYSRQIEHRIIYSDGEIGYIAVRFNIIKDKEGRTIKTYGANQDITERKIAEKELRDSQEKLAGIIQAIPDFMSIIDEEYNMIWANDNLINTYGAIQNRKCYEIYHRLDKPCENCLRNQVLADEKMHQHEAETISSSGEKIYQLTIANVTSHYPDGRPKTVIEISRNITEYKKLEEQFRQAQKMEAIGRLAGGIAHDFNNMLTVIGGNTSLALMNLREDDPLMYDLQQVQKATERASKLTGQLLAFSRRQQLQPKVLNLNHLIADMEKMLVRLIGENIEFKTHLAKDIWNVKVDAGQFEQIIMNLCVNAKQAMAKGGNLTIETQNMHLSQDYCEIYQGSTPGDYVLIAVSDTGCGMSEEVKSRIFEPFFTTKPEGEGTGLGLATVFGIVKQSEGFINVYSEVDKGTTFKIFLPRSMQIAEVKTPEIISSEKLFGNETIMIVEDEDGVRNIAVKTLRKFGYNVIEAENGGVGYLKCKKAVRPFDLIVTDIIMPEMSGKELINSIKEFCPNIKVLYMSGYTYNAIAKQGVIESSINFISKPFDSIAFVRKVREVLNSPSIES